MSKEPGLSERVQEKIPALVKRYQELSLRLADPNVLSDIKLLRTLSKEHASLQPLIEAWEAHEGLVAEIVSNQQMLDDPQEELALKELVEEELLKLKEQLANSEQTLGLLLVPKDPLDDAPVILEVRAGSGGEEAALFAADLVRTYTRYAERQSWRCESISINTSESGGFKEAVLNIQGKGGLRQNEV